MGERSYLDRRDYDSDTGHAIQVRIERAELRITLELGVMRNFGSMSADAWASLTPAEARELADDLRAKAAEVERMAAARREAAHG